MAGECFKRITAGVALTAALGGCGVKSAPSSAANLNPVKVSNEQFGPPQPLEVNTEPRKPKLLPEMPGDNDRRSVSATNLAKLVALVDQQGVRLSFKQDENYKEFVSWNTSVKVYMHEEPKQTVVDKITIATRQNMGKDAVNYFVDGGLPGSKVDGTVDSIIGVNGCVYPLNPATKDKEACSDVVVANGQRQYAEVVHDLMNAADNKPIYY